MVVASQRVSKSASQRVSESAKRRLANSATNPWIPRTSMDTSHLGQPADIADLLTR